MKKIDFEKLDKEALNQSLLVKDCLISEINNQEGWLSFHDFMDFVLYKPGLGYYNTGTHKIGLGGDFTTAPEISNLFGIGVANQLIPVLSQYQNPSVLEIGAGTGKLALDILSHLNDMNIEINYYYILEISADLKQRQKEILNQLPKKIQNKVQWLNNIPSEGIEGALIANEVIDALAFERFKIGDDDILQIGITFDDNQFIEKTKAAPDILKHSVTKIEKDIERSLETGFTSEVRPYFYDWFKTINDGLKSGVALFIDYGYSRKDYYSTQLINGNMICHFQNLAHSDPYIYLGLQDISSSVDFSLLADIAHSLDYKIELYCHQSDFLMNADILSHIESESNGEERMKIIHQIKQLLLPSVMGESFKCMLLSKECSIEHLNEIKDLRYKL